MTIFRLGHEPNKDLDLFGWYGCHIRGVDCPTCTQWGGSALRYPTIACADIAALGGIVSQFLDSGPRDGRRKPPAPMTVAELRLVKAQLEPVLGPQRPVEPGTSFGPATGELRGPVQDFNWTLMSVMFVKQSVFDRMNAAGFAIAGARADLSYKTFRGRRWLEDEGPGEPLIELEVPPIARLIKGSCKQCDLCGRIQLGRSWTLDRAAFDPSVPLQRIFEIPTHVVATGAFREFLRDGRYSGVKITKQKTN